MPMATIVSQPEMQDASEPRQDGFERDSGSHYVTLPDLASSKSLGRYSRPKSTWHKYYKQARSQAESLLPPLKWLQSYEASWLFSDAIGGLTIGMVCLAQTLAHASIATTEPIQGPYCAFVPAIVYAIFGTSPHASVSSGAIAAILIADQLKNDKWSTNIQDRTEAASLLALIAGAALCLMGVCRLAFAVRFLSHPTLSGFFTGGSILIITGQMKNLLGFKEFPHTGNFFLTLRELCRQVTLGNACMKSFILGCCLIIVLDGLNRLKQSATRNLKLPACDPRWKTVKTFTEMKEIVATLIGIVVGYLTAEDGVPTMTTVGEIPAGLPPFRPPWEYKCMRDLFESQDDMIQFVTGGVLVAFTSFLTTFATAKKMAMKFNYTLDPSQEMIALGAAGMCGSFFGAFSPSGSLSRTGLAADCGVKTQLGGIFSAVVIGLGLTYATPALMYLPKCTLAAIIIKSTTSLIDIEKPRKLSKSWKPYSVGGLKRDLIVWYIAFIFTIVCGVLYGIGIAVLVSVALIIADASAPECVVLGHVQGMGQKWRCKTAWPQAETLPGILVFEFRGPLSFASAEWFQEQVEMRRVELDASSETKVKMVVLSFASVHHLDATALEVLKDLLEEWKALGISTMITGTKRNVRCLIEEHLSTLLDQTDFMLNISDAVQQMQKRLHARESRFGPDAVEHDKALQKKSSAVNQIQRVYRRRMSKTSEDSLPKNATLPSVLLSSQERTIEKRRTAMW